MYEKRAKFDGQVISDAETAATNIIYFCAPKKFI